MYEHTYMYYILCILLGKMVRQSLEHISAPILRNRCLEAIVGWWPLAFQVWVLLQYIRARVKLGPSRRRCCCRRRRCRHRNLVRWQHCNQRCIHQPQSNHQSDLEPNIALLFFPLLLASSAFSSCTTVMVCS